MDFGSKNEQVSFLSAHGYSYILDSEQMPGKTTLWYHFETETHTSSALILAKYLADFGNEKATTLVTLDNMYLWPSGRDEYLIKTAFKSITGAKVVQPEDGTMFVWHRSEMKEAITLYHMAMLFGWDAYIYPKDAKVSAFISHDGFIEINTDADPLALATNIKEKTGRKFTLIDQ
ncbi:hypothetical protein [Parasulfitobacter algicola]|uniref:Uncharacterized protein n=1 Tax=Parasulfitobacter algicola TaxID=2614809 RepID=A0ABX2IPM0_9RHOB|nr:hypothetical protein [Sulfitobacter algicola]NSX54822.1 hypothetical protein [Sulfitobacter algicola]